VARHGRKIICRDALHLRSMRSFFVARIAQDHAVLVERMHVAM
jgi:hypothetical protein